MKLGFALFAAILLEGCSVTASAQQTQPSVPDQLKVTIDTQQTADPVSKYIFGSFIEHIGTTIYRSMWAEMLDDRKFYFPISSTDPAPPARPQGQPNGHANAQVAPRGARRARHHGFRTSVCWRSQPQDSARCVHSARHPAGRSLACKRQTVHRQDLSAWHSGSQSECFAELGQRRRRSRDELLFSSQAITRSSHSALRRRPILPLLPSRLPVPARVTFTSARFR